MKAQAYLNHLSMLFPCAMPSQKWPWQFLFVLKRKQACSESPQEAKLELYGLWGWSEMGENWVLVWKYLHFLSFSLIYKGGDNSSTYLIELLWRISEIMFIRLLAQYLRSSNGSISCINVSRCDNTFLISEWGRCKVMSSLS